MEYIDDFDFVPAYNRSAAAPKYDIPEKKQSQTRTFQLEKAAASYNRLVVAAALVLVCVVALTMMTSVIYLNKEYSWL